MHNIILAAITSKRTEMDVLLDNAFTVTVTKGLKTMGRYPTMLAMRLHAMLSLSSTATVSQFWLSSSDRLSTTVTKQPSTWGFPDAAEIPWRYSRPAAHKNACFLSKQLKVKDIEQWWLLDHNSYNMSIMIKLHLETMWSNTICNIPHMQ